MAEPTLNQAILNLTNDELRKQRPLPSKVTVIAVHSDGYIDIVNSNEEIIKNIECIGTPTLNQTALLIQTDNGQMVIV